MSLSRGQSSKFFHEQNHFSVVSDSLWPHGLQHARPPCPSPTPRVYSDSCPLSQWCHPTISSSVITFSSCLQSSPVSGSFQMSQFFASGGKSIRTSASASVLPINIQDWFLLGFTWETHEQFKQNNQYDIIVGYWASLLATLHIWLGVLTLDLLSWHNSLSIYYPSGPILYVPMELRRERKEINVNVKFILPANPWVIVSCFWLWVSCLLWNSGRIICWVWSRKCPQILHSCQYKWHSNLMQIKIYIFILYHS